MFTRRNVILAVDVVLGTAAIVGLCIWYPPAIIAVALVALLVLLALKGDQLQQFLDDYRVRMLAAVVAVGIIVGAVIFWGDMSTTFKVVGIVCLVAVAIIVSAGRRISSGAKRFFFGWLRIHGAEILTAIVIVSLLALGGFFLSRQTLLVQALVLVGIAAVAILATAHQKIWNWMRQDLKQFLIDYGPRTLAAVVITAVLVIAAVMWGNLPLFSQTMWLVALVSVTILAVAGKVIYQWMMTSFFPWLKVYGGQILAAALIVAGSIWIYWAISQSMTPKEWVIALAAFVVLAALGPDLWGWLTRDRGQNRKPFWRHALIVAAVLFLVIWAMKAAPGMRVAFLDWKDGLFAPHVSPTPVRQFGPAQVLNSDGTPATVAYVDPGSAGPGWARSAGESKEDCRQRVANQQHWEVFGDRVTDACR